MSEYIYVDGIQTNNLKNIDVSIEKNALNLIIGPSGSGKTSLAYDTIAQIGLHEFMSMFADDIDEPKYIVRNYRNMIATVPIKQINHNTNVRSTIGTSLGLQMSVISLFSSAFKLPENHFTLSREGNVCTKCHGLGVIKILDEHKLVDFTARIKDNPFRCWRRHQDYYSKMLEKFCTEKGIDPSKTYQELSEENRELLLRGVSEDKYTVRLKNKSSRTSKYFGVYTGQPMLKNFKIPDRFFSDRECTECCGKKYSKECEKLTLNGLSIGQVMTENFDNLIVWLDQYSRHIREPSLQFEVEKLRRFLTKAVEFGLGYLYFHRTIPSLSGGELQRLRMIQICNSQLMDMLVVLDEPLAGLSGEEKSIIYRNIIDLSKKHTTLIVDHGNDFVKAAKTVTTLGPKGGKQGGEIISAEDYLNVQKKQREEPFFVEIPQSYTTLNLRNNIYQYKGVDIQFGDYCLNLLHGRSGIGKSTLLREYFPQRFEDYLYIDQKPLLGNSNSNVATGLDIFTRITNLYANEFDLDRRFFSNRSGDEGTCPVCGGSGYLEYSTVSYHKIRIECQDCEGSGFHKRLHGYKFKERSLFEIWKMTIDEAIPFFETLDKKITLILREASSLMLGHLILGQPISSLSGGENIRIKILKALNSKAQILGIDEPFKGLGENEMRSVIEYLYKLKDKGKTIIIIDHEEAVKKYFAVQLELGVENGILICRPNLCTES